MALFDNIKITPKVRLFITIFAKQTIIIAKKYKADHIKGLRLNCPANSYEQLMTDISKIIVKFNDNVGEKVIFSNPEDIHFGILPKQYKTEIIDNSVECMEDYNLIYDCLEFINTIQSVADVFCVETAKEALCNAFDEDIFNVSALILRIHTSISRGWSMEGIFSEDWMNPTTVEHVIDEANSNAMFTIRGI